MGLFPHILKKKKAQKTNMYNSITPETNDDLYEHGDNFIRRSLHHNETTLKYDLRLPIHHRDIQRATITNTNSTNNTTHDNINNISKNNNNNISKDFYDNKPTGVRQYVNSLEKEDKSIIQKVENSTAIQKEDKSTIIQKEISLFYWHHFQKQKNTFTIAMDTVKRRGRRNAVCEQNEEERVGLRLCVQRYRHLVYMIEYEI